MPLHRSGLPDTTILTLRRQARAAAERAYAPYSRFRVGTALLLDSSEGDEIITGCNVENASYRLTTCAEQTAIVSAVAKFGPKVTIRAIAIENLNGASSPPCGACRQTILEFSTSRTWVFLPEQESSAVDMPFCDLLPLAFHLDTDLR